jgi:hypothetical protein
MKNLPKHPMSKRELEIWTDGLYKGIEIANQKLKEHPDEFGTKLRLVVPSKKKIKQMITGKQ